MYDTITEGEYKYKRMTTSFGGYKPFNDKELKLVGMYRDYDTFFAHLIMLNRLWELEQMMTVRHIDEWAEAELNSDCAVWWRKSQLNQNGEPEEVPIYVGSPLDTNFPDDAEYFLTYPIFSKMEEN